MQRRDEGVGEVHPEVLYSKQEFLRRTGGSQKVWDKMLDDGLPFVNVGHQRFVKGWDVIEHLYRNVKRKREP